MTSNISDSIRANKPTKKNKTNKQKKTKKKPQTNKLENRNGKKETALIFYATNW